MSFLKKIHRWYAEYGRHDLPWRQTDDPYHIYISEVMLQQTQVKTVLERFYFPFLESFPSLQALSDAPEEAVMKRWEGLGYYSRARNLHKAAKISAPTLPDDYAGLIALPGIGQNTAHAILAFAYHNPYPVLEANVKRVLHRIFAIEERNDKALWEAAWELLDKANPFDYNQAMMDVGAMICLPKAPLCESCPAADICKGKHTPLAYPAKKAKKRTPLRRKRLIALRDINGRLHLKARTTRFLGGLYGFIELDASATSFTLAGYELTLSEMHHLGTIGQTYSHFQLQAEVYLAEWPHAANSEDWFTLEDIKQLPLSKADFKLLKLLPSSPSVRK